MARRKFTIEVGKEKIEVEGHAHRNVALKYLMKRRRSILFTKDQAKVEKLYEELPHEIRIIGAQLTKTYDVKWERVGAEEFAGVRFPFNLTEKS